MFRTQFGCNTYSVKFQHEYSTPTLLDFLMSRNGSKYLNVTVNNISVKDILENLAAYPKTLKSTTCSITVCATPYIENTNEVDKTVKLLDISIPFSDGVSIRSNRDKPSKTIGRSVAIGRAIQGLETTTCGKSNLRDHLEKEYKAWIRESKEASKKLKE